MMVVKGNLRGLSLNWQSHRPEVTFEVAGKPEELEKYKDKDLSIEIKQWREKRSLEANAYFHVLVGKIADVLNISKSHCKNILICRYGQQDFTEDGTEIVIKTNIQPEQMQEQEFLHCLPCRADGNAVFYKVFRGSHTYDTAEMSHLIDGTVSECKELGIETLTPDELERMMIDYDQKHHAK